MNKLEELIKDFCPNGVEYKPLEECCSILDNKRKPVTKSVREYGEYPYYGANGIQDYVSDYIFDGVFVLVGEDGSVLTSNGTPVVNWAEGKIWVNNHAHIIAEKEGILLRYLYHYLQTISIVSLVHGNIPKLTGSDFKSLQIPVPALPVQREIVRILDSFTLYSAELTAELTARRKQYEFYRDKLLHYECCNKIETIGENIEWLKTGLNPRQNFKLNEPEANCFYITGKDIFNNRVNVTEKTDKITQNTVLLINRRANLQDNILLFASTGTGTVGRMAVIDRYDFSWNVSETMYCIKPKGNKLLVKYLMYFLYSQTARNEFEPKISKGSVPHLKVADLLNVHINLPPMEVQERIVKVLDNFDEICSDLKIGLPAEMEKRQQQYEYYRDKLLTFDTKSETILNRQTDRQTDRQG